jgi:Cu+-exporting ATPase
MMKDPGCGMDVKPEKAAAKSDHHGQTYHFCSTDCKSKFDKSPGQYAKQQAQQSKPAQPAS